MTPITDEHRASAEGRPTQGTFPPGRVVGTSYAWGVHEPGWAIWVKAQPTAPILRFGPGEREKARRLFEQLEVLEGKTSFPGGSGERTQFVLQGEMSGVQPSEWPALPLPPLPGSIRMSRARLALTKVANGVIVVAILAALAAVAALVIQMPRNAGAERREAASEPISPPQGTLPTTPGTSSDVPGDNAPAVPGVQVYASTAGGFLFSYPDAWTVTEQGAEAVLTSPDGAVRVVFGRTPGGSLSRASDVLVEHVMSSHTGVQVLSSSRASTEQGLRTVLVGGTLDETGRFLAISVEGLDDNKAITVFFPKGRQTPQLLRAIRAVIASYRVSTQA